MKSPPSNRVNRNPLAQDPYCDADDLMEVSTLYLRDFEYHQIP